MAKSGAASVKLSNSVIVMAKSRRMLM